MATAIKKTQKHGHGYQKKQNKNMATAIKNKKKTWPRLLKKPKKT
jgi:hypothetical protein